MELYKLNQSSHLTDMSKIRSNSQTQLLLEVRKSAPVISWIGSDTGKS